MLSPTNFYYHRVHSKLKRIKLIWQINFYNPRKIILGAGTTNFPGWITTDIDNLDIVNYQSWNKLFGNKKIDALLAEHVWEHLTLSQSKRALKLCLQFLKPGGYLRLAIPDGYHSDSKYLKHVRPGGTGPGADDHKVLYNLEVLSQLLQSVGFVVKPLEYFDAKGKFHHFSWDSKDGHIYRSFKNDPRNNNGKPIYTSLIVDAFKPNF